MEIVFSPSDFVAVLNQTLDYAYPLVTIEGEISNIRVSRGKWVYFDVKDDTASIKCFGTVYMLPGPLEDGMMVRIVASPRLHQLYNFSLNLQSVTPVGEGSLKKAADLLFAKLDKEGLFDPARKRAVPYAPERIGLITSKESAAYADFTKILGERWGGVHITHVDVQVQGEPAVTDIVQAIDRLNQLPEPPEVIVITRGGGSADDLAAFGAEQIVRAIAASRVPTLVAIGHEIDESLAELAADMRASTPSNAAELLVPDKKQVLIVLKTEHKNLSELVLNHVKEAGQSIKETVQLMRHLLEQSYLVAGQTVGRQSDLLEALNPQAALKRGYAVIRSGNSVITGVKKLKSGDDITITMQDGTAEAKITS